jgi:glucokinase
MQTDEIMVFDLGGTWFRWGHYVPARGLLDAHLSRAISYLSHPQLTAVELQLALSDFIVQHTRRAHGRTASPQVGCVSIGAPVNAHDETVLGSGPLWGPTAQPFELRARLVDALPELRWYVVNDVAAMLARYMSSSAGCRKTLLVTVSTGIGGRIYDHVAGRIPYDATHGIQGEMGHLPVTFVLDGRVINRRCECGGWNHLNAFSSGRGIAQTLAEYPDLSERFSALFCESPTHWTRTSDDDRLGAFKLQLEKGNEAAAELLDALVTPVSRSLATAVSFDPDIDRIVITGGVSHGLGKHYRAALERTFARDGLYQISERDPDYLARRVHWEDPDEFAGLRGAGMYAQIMTGARNETRN